MPVTTAEDLTVDGISLKTYAKNVETLGAMLSASGKRGSNAIVAQRDGSLWTPYKAQEEGQIVLPMWVLGCDDDGLIPGGSSVRKEFYKRIDELTRLFQKDYALLDVRHILPDGSTRRALCECKDVINFATDGWGEPRGLFTVTLVNVDAFWKDVATTSQNAITAGAPASAAQWVWATGGSAPVNDATITMKGPFTSMTVTDVTSGAFVKYAGTLTAAQTVVLNCDTFNITGTGGLTPDMSKVTYGKTGNRLMRLTPRQSDGAYLVYATYVAGTSGTTNLTIVGYKKYKVG